MFNKVKDYYQLREQVKKEADADNASKRKAARKVGKS